MQRRQVEQAFDQRDRANRHAEEDREQNLSIQEVRQMRRVLFISFTGVVVGGCAGPDITRPPAEPSLSAPAAVSASRGTAKSKASPTGALDDAIDRLAPALGPAGAALGAPLRQLRDGGRLDAQLIDATRRQFEALIGDLPPETAADADALGITLDALRAMAGK